MAKNSGTLVIAAVRPYDSADAYPTVLGTEIKGGVHAVADAAARNAIATDRREWGMIAYLEDTKLYYTLKSGVSSALITDNANWTLLSGEMASTGGLQVERVNLTIGTEFTDEELIASFSGVVTKITVKVTTAYDNSATFSIGRGAVPVVLMATTENDCETTDTYVKDFGEAITAENINYTSTGMAGASTGALTLIVEYDTN